MDSYVESFMKAGGSFISLAKGNRSKVVRSEFAKAASVIHKLSTSLSR
jgi:hypothetical protein